MNAPLKVGTRRSPLARTQTGHVRDMLDRFGVASEEVLITSAGDEDRTRPLHLIGSDPGFFTRTLEDALRARAIDVAVHSLKDLPLESPAELPVVAIPAREDARDVIVAHADRVDARTIVTPGTRVGSSSPRRQTQLLAIQPEAVMTDVRGNVGTRLALLDDGTIDALLVARAALNRLAWEPPAHLVLNDLTLDRFPTAPGQGALAIQMRADDPRVPSVAELDDADTRACVLAERGLLDLLGGGCSLPLGASVWRDADGWRLAATYAESAWYAPGYAGLKRTLARASRVELLAGLALQGLGEVAPAPAAAPAKLAATRILVAFAEDAADAFVDALRGAGAQAAAWSLTEQRALGGDVPDAVREAWSRAHWVAVASPRAVDAIPRLEHAGGARAVKVAAVGPGTALALRRADLPVHLVAPDGSGASLAAALARVAPKGATVILPRAARATPDLAQGLMQAGLDPVPWAVYETVERDPAPPSPFARADVIIVGAPSTARVLAKAPGAAAIAARWVALGPSTAKALREAGLPVHVVAPRRTPASLIEVLSE